MESLPDPNAGSNAPWIRRLARAGATWVRALCALPMNQQQAVLVEIVALLAEDPES